MTVSELIKELKKFPSHTRVLVSGYEGGFDDPIVTGLAEIDFDCSDSSVFGKHERKGEGWDKPKSTGVAVLIERPGR